MRPSTSMQAQFRPISPSPPRKTIRTAEPDPVVPRFDVLAAFTTEPPLADGSDVDMPALVDPGAFRPDPFVPVG